MEECGCEHRVDMNGPFEDDDGSMVGVFGQMCMWGKCLDCHQRILIVDDVGNFTEEELNRPYIVQAARGPIWRRR